jgi:hypothetical protein
MSLYILNRLTKRPMNKKSTIFDFEIAQQLKTNELLVLTGFLEKAYNKDTKERVRPTMG